MASKLKAVSARKGTTSANVQPALANTPVHGSCVTVLPKSWNLHQSGLGMLGKLDTPQMESICAICTLGV